MNDARGDQSSRNMLIGIIVSNNSMSHSISIPETAMNVFGHWRPNIWHSGQFWNLEPKILVLVWTCILEGVNTMTNAASPFKFSQRSWFWTHLKEISALPARLLHHFDFKRAWPSSVFLLCMFTPCESYSVYEWKIIAAYLKGFF